MEEISLIILRPIIKNIIEFQDIINYAHTNKRIHKLIMSDYECQQQICDSLGYEMNLREFDLDKYKNFQEFAENFFKSKFSKYLTTNREIKSDKMSFFVNPSNDSMITFRSKDLNNCMFFNFTASEKSTLVFINKEILIPKIANFQQILFLKGYFKISDSYARINLSQYYLQGLFSNLIDERKKNFYFDVFKKYKK